MKIKMGTVPENDYASIYNVLKMLAPADGAGILCTVDANDLVCEITTDWGRSGITLIPWVTDPANICTWIKLKSRFPDARKVGEIE